MDDIFAGSFGFPITLEMNSDLSDATTVRLKIVTPKNTKLDRNIERDSIVNLVKGTVVYNVQQNDFGTAGLYKLQLFDETEGRRKGGTILQIRVRKSLDFKGTS